MILQVQNVSKSFRGLRAVHDASFEVPEGDINGLIGPNGAGKTTIFNMIAGVYAPDSGTIHFRREKNRRAASRPGLRRRHRPHLPDRQALRRPVGARQRDGGRLPQGAYARRARERLRFPSCDKLNLGAKADLPASSLTLPDRKRLEVARALATRPRLLLLDEVMAGLRPTETDQMVAVFREINRADGLTILLIEHVMRAVMALAQAYRRAAPRRGHRARHPRGNRAPSRRARVLPRRRDRSLMLSVQNLDLFYGDAQALSDVSLEVGQGEIVAIVGANGAGKSSLIRCIAGIRGPVRHDCA